MSGKPRSFPRSITLQRLMIAKSLRQFHQNLKRRASSDERTRTNFFLCADVKMTAMLAAPVWKHRCKNRFVREQDPADAKFHVVGQPGAMVGTRRDRPLDLHRVVIRQPGYREFTLLESSALKTPNCIGQCRGQFRRDERTRLANTKLPSRVRRLSISIFSTFEMA
jgi:hypothetical protein